jgi:uncharacterized membrane protein
MAHTMICTYCAAEMPEISVFCPGCGRSVNAPEEVSATSARDAVLGGLSYVTVVPAIVFLAVPAFRSNRFVRLHSWQSVFFFAAAAVTALLLKVLFAVFSILPAIGFLVAWLLVGVTLIAMVMLWAVLTLKAVQGQSYELPILGRIAASLAD